MNPYYLVSLCVMVTAGIGLIIFEVLLLLDNKKFWDSIDKQRYGCYNNSVQKSK